MLPFILKFGGEKGRIAIIGVMGFIFVIGPVSYTHLHDTDNFPIAIGEYVSIEELNEMYEMIEDVYKRQHYGRCLSGYYDSVSDVFR